MKRRNDKGKKMKKFIMNELPNINEEERKIFLNEIWDSLHQLQKEFNKLKYIKLSPQAKIEKETEIAKGTEKIINKINSKLGLPLKVKVTIPKTKAKIG